ncbi:MAG: hypothetical protein AVDCRST_MAG69-2785, partial [uncultured Solirubrobacteraceae bacterium]
ARPRTRPPAVRGGVPGRVGRRRGRRRRPHPAAGAADPPARRHAGPGARHQQALERLRHRRRGVDLRAAGEAGPAHGAADGRRRTGGLRGRRGVRVAAAGVGVPPAR